MKWCDRLSLILCQQQIPDNNRKLEINDGPDGQNTILLSLMRTHSQLLLGVLLKIRSNFM